MPAVPSRLSLRARASLVVGLWVVVFAILALLLRGFAWVAGWANAALLPCLALAALVASFSFAAAAVRLSIDTARGRYPYEPQGPDSGDLQASYAGRSRPSLKRAAGILAVAAVTTALSLIFLEAGLRLFAPQTGIEMQQDAAGTLFTPDLSAGYRNASSAHASFRTSEFNTTVKTGNYGLREDHDVAAPNPTRLRLLCLGDSFTFGYGVNLEQAFPALLNSGTLESLNAGVLGYGTDNEAAWLSAYGWQLQPGIVLLGFYVGNDVRDVMLGMGKTEVDAQGQLVITQVTRQPERAPKEEKRTGPVWSVKSWLAHNSQAYVFLRSLAHNLVDTKSAQVARTPDLFDVAPFYYKQEPQDIAAGWQKTLGLLDRIRAGVQAHGARLLVVVIPTREQVDDTYWRAMLKRFSLAEDDLQRDKPQAHLARWSESSSVPIIDLLPGFRTAPGGPFYYRQDPHWNPAGHKLAAELIKEKLAGLKLLAP